MVCAVSRSFHASFALLLMAVLVFWSLPFAHFASASCSAISGPSYAVAWRGAQVFYKVLVDNRVSPGP
jgi:hypothetical protein